MMPITHVQTAMFFTRRGANRTARRLASDPLVGMVAVKRIARFAWHVGWTLELPELDS